MTELRAGLRDACEKARAAGGTVGLVPTMGSLHAGHRSLLDRARADCAFVAMTLFVNPLQFDDLSDLEAYPRTRQHDLAVADEAGCDLVFAPTEKEMFPAGTPEVGIDPGPLGARLEGASRPGHFRGVLTVVAKLLDLVGPSRSYFGEKDAQQLELIRRMVRDLDMPAQVVGCPTVRDPDGVALSSRNGMLSNEERRAARSLFDALSNAAEMAVRGEPGADVIRAAVARRIGSEPLARLDYTTAVDDETWDEVEEVSGRVRFLVAARFGRVRLIDNLAVDSVQNRRVSRRSP